ncbi:MAG TPA: EcsC family protein [Nocardioides sp.]|jgi:hypothetical protein|nr:EcsC family protein [Nocardioides sp.]
MAASGSTPTSTSRVPQRITDFSPGLTAAFVREALHRAIDGIGPLTPARVAAEKQLAEHRGRVTRAIHGVIDNHVRYAGAQGFVTNLGGLATLPVAIPTNVTGLALVQCRMIAAVAHLRGYDLDDPRVRNGVLVCMLGEESVAELVRAKKIPAPPMALATAPVYDPTNDLVISTEVAGHLVQRVAGKKLAGTAARRVPLIGGLVGMGADGYLTWKNGRYAERELLPLARR